MGSIGDWRILAAFLAVVAGLWFAARLAFVPLVTGGSEVLASPSGRAAGEGSVVVRPRAEPADDGVPLEAIAGVAVGGVVGLGALGVALLVRRAREADAPPPPRPPADPPPAV